MVSSPPSASTYERPRTFSRVPSGAATSIQSTERPSPASWMWAAGAALDDPDAVGAGQLLAVAPPELVGLLKRSTVVWTTSPSRPGASSFYAPGRACSGQNSGRPASAASIAVS